MKIYEKLMLVQSELVAKKTEFNAFGKYSYRSLENILESLKPLLLKHKLVYKLDNAIEVFNGVVYRKSTGTLIDIESGEKIDSVMYTQESFDKKGMSPEQCSGSTASYSDKYVTHKLFCIDDTKDADATNTQGQDITPIIKKAFASSNGSNVGGKELVCGSPDYIFTGGKYNGKKISDIPKVQLINYLGWMKENSKGTKSHTQENLEAYLQNEKN